MRARFSRSTLFVAAVATVLAGCGGGGHNSSSGGGSSASLTLTSEPKSSAVAAGGKATFSVTATGTGLTYQWYENGAAISGATSSSYTTAALTADDNGATFYCIVTSDSGSTKSATATLTIGTASAPIITTQPSSVTAPVGDTASFTVVASGDGLTYQWYHGGAAIPGATGATYTISPVSTSSAGTYDVVVSNVGGTVTSSKINLTIGSANAPTISTQPASQTVLVGATVSLSVGASGSGTLTYQWYENGTAISGATGATYQFKATATSGGSYTVTVTNGIGNVTSNPATITVESAPIITTPPSNQTAFTTQSATFTVTASGNDLAYQWSKDGAAISGATGASFTISPVQLSSAGAYKVTVSNLAGSVSASATLTVYPGPTITTQPASLSVGQGSTATFTVGATGNSLTFQWSKNGTAISGATSTSYTTPATVQSDSGATFQCTVTNPGGSATSNSATLTVVPAPVITGQPTNQTVTAPATATFTVTATSPNSGTLTYAWYKVGSTTVVGTAASYTTPATDSSFNGNQYYVVVTNNGVATVQSSTVTLTVH